MDEFTRWRLLRLIENFRWKNGRDISFAELEVEGFSSRHVAWLIRKRLADKYAVQTATGRAENRYRLHRDWRSLCSN